MTKYICEGCEGDGTCQIQDDKNDPQYSCLINSRWSEAQAWWDSGKQTLDELAEEYAKIREKVLEWDLTHQRDKHAAPTILTDLEAMLGIEG